MFHFEKVKAVGTAVAIAVVSMISSNASAQTYSDDYSSPAQASNYQTDRRNPGGFTISGGTLNLNVLAADEPGFESSFYNFHGIQTLPASEINAGPGSIASVDLFVPTSWDGATSRRGGDFWVRIDDVTQPNPGSDFYPSIGVYNYADGGGALVSLFTPTAGGFDNNPLTNDPFLDLPGVAINFDAFNTLAMQLTNTGVQYLFNGSVVATVNDLGYTLPGTQIDQAFLQGWQGDTDYVASFDNLTVVPEPASFGLLAVGGIALLGRRGNRRR